MSTVSPLPRRLASFTLIELLTVMAIIAILAGLVLSISGYVNKKGATARATAEIQALSSACESYKSDNGAYPQIPVSGAANVNAAGYSSNIPSDNLDPRSMGNPNSPYTGVTTAAPAVTYGTCSFELYAALTSDTNGTQQNLGGAKNYLPDIRTDMLGRSNMSAPASASNPVTYLSDPFGNAYGYSTANAFYQAYVNAGGAAKATPPGYNSTYDLWSTGGGNSNPNTGSSAGQPGDPALQWITNWRAQ